MLMTSPADTFLSIPLRIEVPRTSVGDVFFGIHDVGSEDESCFTALNDHDNGPGTVGLDDSALLAMGEGPAVVLELNLLR